MTDLLSLLDEPENFARTSDPVASKDAAAKGDSFGPMTERVMRALVDVERTNPHREGATANEIQMRMAYDSTPAPDRNSISRRITSLKRRGLVRESHERRDGGRGVLVSVYCATQEGRDWLRG